MPYTKSSRNTLKDWPIKRSFDLPLLLKLTNVPGIHATAEDFKTWFNRPGNVMFSSGENVGLATYEYPGVYSLHWYFTVRGRDAINLGKAMIVKLFKDYGAETVRGFVREDLKASRWAARQLGLKSYGVITFADNEPNELFIATKDDYLNQLKECNNG